MNNKLEDRYKVYTSFVDSVINDKLSQYKNAESKIENNWSEVKRKYGIQDSRTMKDILQESINTPSDTKPSPFARIYYQDTRYGDISRNKEFADTLQGGRKYGVEQESKTIDNLIKNAGKIGPTIADHLTIKKVHGKNAIVLDSTEAVSQDVKDVLQEEINKNLKAGKARGSNNDWEAKITVQSISKQNVTDIDHRFVVDVWLVDKNSGSRMQIPDIMEEFSVEEKNVKTENLPQNLIDNYAHPRQWQWKYKDTPYYIYKGEVYSATDMINKVGEELKKRSTFIEFINKQEGGK